MGKFYLFPDGSFHDLTPANGRPGDDEGPTVPKGAKKVPRLPKAGEVWDGKAYVLDEEVEVRLHENVAEVAENHVIKQIEATLILSGYDLKVGLLAAEAKTTGVDISVIADKVMDKAQDQMARETTRRKKIHDARQKGTTK